MNEGTAFLVNVKFAFTGYATETKIPRLLWCNLKEKTFLILTTALHPTNNKEIEQIFQYIISVL